MTQNLQTLNVNDKQIRESNNPFYNEQKISWSQQFSTTY